MHLLIFVNVQVCAFNGYQGHATYGRHEGVCYHPFLWLQLDCLGTLKARQDSVIRMDAGRAFVPRSCTFSSLLLAPCLVPASFTRPFNPLGLYSRIPLSRRRLYRLFPTQSAGLYTILYLCPCSLSIIRSGALQAVERSGETIRRSSPSL